MKPSKRPSSSALHSYGELVETTTQLTKNIRLLEKKIKIMEKKLNERRPIKLNTLNKDKIYSSRMIS